MNDAELKKELKNKTIEFEIAREAGKSHLELLKIYKEIKKIQYQIIQLELSLA